LVLICTNTPGKGEGWNLLGNPFASGIDWNLLTKGDGIDAALYYYDNTEMKYRYYLQYSGDDGTYTINDGQQYIPAMQGFMVHANISGTKTLTFTNAARTHTGQNVYYKATNTAPGSFVLTVSANGHEDETFVHFTGGATTSFDGAYDAYKLKSYSETVPNLYTIATDGSELAINGLPEVAESTVIPLAFSMGTDGVCVLSANLESFSNAHIYLEDVKLNKVQNLSTNPVYTFTSSATDDPNRFKLSFGSVGIDDNPSASDMKVLASNGNIYLSLQQNSMAVVKVYNLTGQLVLQGNVSGKLLTTLNANGLSNGVYIANVVQHNRIVSYKLVISK